MGIVKKTESYHRSVRPARRAGRGKSCCCWRSHGLEGMILSRIRRYLVVVVVVVAVIVVVVVVENR